MSSGTAIKPWSLVTDPEAQALNLGKLLNCSVENSTVMVKCLKGLDAKTLVSAHLDAIDVSSK